MENNDEEEVKEEMKEKDKRNVKDKKLTPFIMILVFLVISFGSGFVLGKVLYDEKEENIVKEQVNDKNDDKEDVIEEQVDDKDDSKEDAVPYTDKYAMGTYGIIGGGFEFYLIDNGDLYYTNSNYILTHSGCLYDPSTEYCKHNKAYSERMTKVEGISNVKRIKMYNMPGATGETFQCYAITEDGNVYKLNRTKASIFLDNHDVDDMLGQRDNGFEILLKNGKRMLYSWKWKENLEREYSYTEIK